MGLLQTLTHAEKYYMNITDTQQKVKKSKSITEDHKHTFLHKYYKKHKVMKQNRQKQLK